MTSEGLRAAHGNPLILPEVASTLEMPQVFTFAFGDEDVEGGQVGDRSAAQDVDKSRAEEASDQAIAPYELHFDDMVSTHKVFADARPTRRTPCPTMG